MDAVVRIPVGTIRNKEISHEAFLSIIIILFYYSNYLPEFITIHTPSYLFKILPCRTNKVHDDLIDAFDKGVFDLYQRKYINRLRGVSYSSHDTQKFCLLDKFPPLKSTCISVPLQDIQRLLTCTKPIEEICLLIRTYAYVLYYRSRILCIPSEIKNKFFIKPWLPAAQFLFPVTYMTKKEKSAQFKKLIQYLSKLKLLKVYYPAKGRIFWQYGRVDALIYKPEDELYLGAMLHFLHESKSASKDRKKTIEYHPEHEVLFVTDDGDEFMGYRENSDDPDSAES